MNTHVPARGVALAIAVAALLAASAMPAFLSAQTGTTGTTGSAGAPTAGSMLSSGSVRAGTYRIQPGDIVQYRVWPNAEITGEFPVESSGLVYLPMLGPVQVGGQTVDDTRNKLREMYGKLVQGSTAPVVTMTVQFGFSITGGVANGGMFEGKAGMTVFDAVSRAGGFRNEAVPKFVDVIHADGTATRLDLDGTAGGVASALTAVLLQSQDRVTVPVAHRTFTTQNLYLGLQMALGLITVIKLFGK